MHKTINYDYRYPLILLKKFSEYQRNANRRLILWGLSVEEFAQYWQIPCAYCGSEISTIGIDRIDSNEDYNIYNVCSCCTLCNRMKADGDKYKFINQCRKVAQYYCD